MNFTFHISVSRNDCQSPLPSSLAEMSSVENIIKLEEVHSDQSSAIAREQKIVTLMREKPQDYLKDLEEEINKVENVNLFIQGEGLQYNLNLLFHASRENCPQAVEFLLKKGADPTLVNSKGTTVLHLMAKRGQVEMAKACLSKIDNKKKARFINDYEESGWTTLMSAAENNQYEFAKWLLSEKATVNTQMKTGWTAMHAAAKKGNWSIIELLLENGGNKHLLASHRNFGTELKPEDVAKDYKTRFILRGY